MYQNNIYIQNHEEVAAMGGDIGVSELLSPGDKRLLMDSGCFAAD